MAPSSPDSHRESSKRNLSPAKHWNIAKAILLISVGMCVMLVVENIRLRSVIDMSAREALKIDMRSEVHQNRQKEKAFNPVTPEANTQTRSKEEVPSLHASEGQPFARVKDNARKPTSPKRHSYTQEEDETHRASTVVSHDQQVRDRAEKDYAQLHALLTTVDRDHRCRRLAMVGGRCFFCKNIHSHVFRLQDGAKAVCYELLRPNCSVLSFGINYDFSFDLGMEDLDCTVHSFDPTMGVTGFRRSENVHFHGVGIGAHDDFSAAFPVASLATIIRMIPPQRDIIDYVKLDIECNEWELLQQQLTSSGELLRVRQLTIEFHLMQWKPQLSGEEGVAPEPSNGTVTAENAARFVTVLTSLWEAGFRLVHTEPYSRCFNYSTGCLPFIFETLWININID